MSLSVLIPLSEINIISSGTNCLKWILFVISTVKFFRFLLFTPIIFAPAFKATLISFLLCASTNEDKPKLVAISIKWIKC